MDILIETSSDLKDHEKSVNQKECFIKWMDLATRMKKNESVNECNLKKIIQNQIIQQLALEIKKSISSNCQNAK